MTLRCSTPFGIIGIRTIVLDGARRRDVVLNAFRHHRNSHWGNALDIMNALECSTPFGIIGIRTTDGTVDIAGAALCSTPFGIIGIRTYQ